MRLVTATYVFLDTEVFAHANFDYQSSRFEALTALARSRRIQVFVTDLTIREIKAQIRQRIEKAASMRVEPVLRNSRRREVKRLFNKLDVGKIQDELYSQLDAFMKRAHVKTLKIQPRVLKPVIDKYFDQQPPFCRGRNKAEFPDAFVLQTLVNWCQQSDRIMAVVSGDQGIQAACPADESLHSYENLAKYLDAVASENEMLASFVRQTIVHDDHKKEILRRAKTAFAELGTYLTDVDGDVDGIDLIAMAFESDDVEIIELAENRAQVEISSSLTFTAELSYDEPSTGAWDSEDKRFYFSNRRVETVERTDDRSVDAILEFEGPAPDSFQVTEVSIEGSDVSLTSDYEADWPYK